jgi:hypothetical protein
MWRLSYKYEQKKLRGLSYVENIELDTSGNVTYRIMVCSGVSEGTEISMRNRFLCVWSMRIRRLEFLDSELISIVNICEVKRL